MAESDRNEALFWLNHRCGEQVAVEIGAEVDGSTATFLELNGELRHWRQDEYAHKAVDPAELHDDIMGLYYVGDAGLDLTRLLDHATVIHGPSAEQRMVVSIANGITLTIIRISD